MRFRCIFSKKTNFFQGFSLVELMVSIGIICVLAALALASYSRYVLKSRVSEGVALLKHYARQYEEYYAVNGFLPQSMPETLIASPNTAGLKEIWAGSYSTTGTGMFIYAIFQDSLGLGINNRVVLALIPNASSRVINMYCGQWQTTLYVPIDYLPTGCNRTNISSLPGLVN